MNSIVSEVTPEALEEADAELVIIGNGSPKMLPSYKSELLVIIAPRARLTRRQGDEMPI